ncbi:MAG: hypothetical protein ABL958_09470 [Bdellovibrionia bacterium]
MSVQRKVAFGLLAVVLLSLGYIHLKGPDQLVMKFDFEGRPLHWASRAEFIGFHLLFLGFTNGLILGIQRIFGRDPALTWINIPNKAHWTKAENAQEALKRLRILLDGVLIFVNSLTLGTLAVTAGRASPILVNAFVLGSSLGVGVLLVWIYRLFATRK